MNTLTKKKIGLGAQYFIWSLMASAFSGTTHLRVSAFVGGLMILMTLAGMQLTDILKEIVSNKERIFFVLLLASCVILGLFLF